VALTIQSDREAFPPSWPYQGLDVREALPPLLRPGVLMDWASHQRWEDWAVSILAREGWTAEEVMATLSETAEEVRGWSPAAGAFAAFLESRLHVEDRPRAEPAWPSFAQCLDAWRDAAAAVPRPDLRPSPPEGLAEADRRWVQPAWSALALPVRRYLAARALASWCAQQGEGLRTTVHSVRVALLVLRVEAARVCVVAHAPLDRNRLREAVRATDLLLVHFASPEELARRWSRVEREASPPPP
jgi:hypothetical protein